MSADDEPGVVVALHGSADFDDRIVAATPGHAAPKAPIVTPAPPVMLAAPAPPTLRGRANR